MKSYSIDKYWVHKSKDSSISYLYLGGWTISLIDNENPFELLVNNNKTPYHLKTFARKDVQKKYKLSSSSVGFEVFVEVNETINKVDFSIFDQENHCEHILFNEEELVQKDAEFKYVIDKVNKVQKQDLTEIQVLGWAVFDMDSIVDFDVLENKKSIDFSLQRMARLDVVQDYLALGNAKYCGFMISFQGQENKKYNLCLKCAGQQQIVPIKQNTQRFDSKVKTIAANLNRDNILYAKEFIRDNGWKEFIRTLTYGRERAHYNRWFLTHRISKADIEKQKQVQFSYQPKISIIVATFNTAKEFLDDMIGSVLKQSYSNWQLCIADGSDSNFVIDYLEAKYKNNNQIVWKKLEKNFGISGNMNGALELADGDYVGLYDHDDFLEPNCLFEVVQSLQDFKYDIIYTDEDKYDNDAKIYQDPNFKPDYNVDLFRSHNYITHFFCVNKKIIDQVGGMNPEFDGSQDYDFMFRCIEKANAIYHIPKILYHWRIHPLSTAGNPESKMYCYEAGQKAIQAHYDRTGVDAKVEMMPKPYYGLYHTTYSTKDNPLVSIIIPNMNHKDILKTCIDSLFEKNIYSNFEIIIIENNSNQQEIFDYYKELETLHTNVHVVYWEGIFNYSAINNFGVKAAKGDYFLFLNNDTEVISPNAIKEMLGCCMRPEVGIVGAKLLYADDTVQHAGVVVGFNNYAGHVFTEIGKDDFGYMMRPIINCDYSAVTAACMMVKKSVFEEVDGFDEQFEVACNDVDFCLRVRQLNKLVVYNAFALWHHYESKSRGYENSLEKVERFEVETNKFYKRWKSFIDQGDPYYNKNFKIEYGPFKYDKE